MNDHNDSMATDDYLRCLEDWTTSELTVEEYLDIIDRQSRGE